MCTRPIRINGFTLPCGKCPECLKSQELTLGFYGMCNASRFIHVASITLSYDDDHIPLVSNTLLIDHSSKTYRSLYDYNITAPERDLCAYSDSSDEMRKIWLSRDKSKGYVQIFSPHSPVVVDDFTPSELKGYTHDGYFDYSNESLTFDYVNLIHPIGLISHLQSWFKKLREYHYRIYGFYPDMSYTAVMEYGPATGRPHFHVCLFFNNMDKTFLRNMCYPDEFTLKYSGVNFSLTGWSHGSVNKCTIHDVASLGKDGKPHYVDALHFAKYVAKYGKKSDKGKNFIELARLVPPSRRLTSKGFKDSAKRICEEIILKDVPKDFWHIPSEELYERLDELMPYAEVIKDRMSCKYSILPSCKPQKIPNDVLLHCLNYTYFKTLYGYEIYNPKKIPIRKEYACSALYLAVKIIERSDNLEDSIRSFSEFSRVFAGQDKTISQIAVLFQSHLYSLMQHRESSSFLNDDYTEPLTY